MSNIINSKKKRKNNSGFTLVELLATIAILSIVSVIVIYTATNVIGSAKNNSYKVTINNIQKDANTYVLENDKNINWLNFNDGTNSSYQCIKVQNLIDMGYFDNNILDSLVSEDRNVLANDYIYIEKDNNTKVITKQILLYDTTSPLTSLCGDYINSNGIIDFSFFSEWAKSKDVIITYKLDNDISVGDSNNYNYSYLYNGNCINEDNVCSFGFTTMKTAVKKITLYEEGYLSANITKKDGQTVRTNGVDINKIDTVGPVIENLSLKEISDIKTVRGETSVLIRINDKKNNSNEECNENSELNCGSGLNLDTIKTENFKVSIGGNFINDYQLEKKSCDSSKEINYCNYNLKITNYNYVGDLVIEI